MPSAARRPSLFLAALSFARTFEVFERGRVAGDGFPAGDFLQQPAHDFAAARFRQRLGEAHFIRLRDRADVLADMLRAVLPSALGVGVDAASSP